MIRSCALPVLLRSLLLALLCACNATQTSGPGPSADGGPSQDGASAVDGGDGGGGGGGLRAAFSVSPRRLRLGVKNTLTLDASASSGAGLRFRWDIGRATFVEGDAASKVAKIEASGDLPLPLSLVVENDGGKDMTGATVTVNQAPSARLASGLRVVPVGQALTLDASASSDPDGDPLTFSFALLQQPGGAALPGQGATATLTPALDGLYLAEVTVSDGVDSARAQATVLAQSGDAVAPAATVVATPNLVTVGDTVTIQVTSSDNRAVARRALQVAGAAVTLNGDSATFKPQSPGRFPVVFDVTDGAGNRARATTEIFAHASGATNSNNLQVAISGPDENNDLDRPTAITGTASGDNFAGYVLEARPARTASAEQLDFRLVGRGAAAVTNGTLGTLDTTLLLNDTYELRLTAYDTFGNSRYTARGYTIVGRRKIGGMNLSVLDAAARSGPVDFNLSREYRSFNKARGDFGVGWTLQISDTRLEISATPGEGWAVTCAFFGGMTITPARGHRVTLRLGDTTYRFFFNPQPKGCFGFTYLLSRFDPLPGTKATLVPDGPTDLTYNDGNKLLTTDGFGNGPAYSPAGYTLTTEDGYKLHFTGGGKMDRVVTPANVEVTIDATGVHRGAAYDVRFTRDAAGRITSLATADGKSRGYQYDGNGDLVLTSDFDSNQVVYRYDEDHNLSGLYSPSGRAVQRNEYDADGRLIAIIDGNGRRVELSHRLGERKEVVTDRLGQTTVTSYDEAGNVTEVTDATGATTRTSYDARGNPLTRTDALGKVTSLSYDGDGNLLKVSDPLGRTTTFAYDANGRMSESTDPAGRKSTFQYDAAGRQILEVLPNGQAIASTYDANGRVLSRTAPDGRVQTYEYDQGGHLIGLTDPSGARSSYKFDSAGNPTERTLTLDTGSGAQVLTAQVQYSKQGLFLSSTMPEGGTSRFQYNVDGSPAGYSDAGGRETKVEANGNGLGTRMTNPGGSTFTMVRDANDNAVGTLSSEGLMTRQTRDANGRPISESDSAGNTVRRSYDAAGRVTSITDAAGLVTRLEYDDAGQLSAVVRPGGARSEYGYNRLGDPVEFKDAAGRVLRRETDFYNNTTGLLTSAGRRLFTATYDVNGRPLTVSDPTGATLSYSHGPYGTDSITDAMGRVTRFKNNAAGAVTEVSDARGKVTRYQVSATGRLLARTLPSGAQATYQYDSTGRLARFAAQSGADVQLQYDAIGRLSQRTASDGTSEVYGYGDRLDGPPARVTTADGTTQVFRDPDGRVLRVVSPSGDEIGYKYAAGRLVEVTTQAGLTRYEYDAAGRTSRVTGPDGGALELRYDLLDRVIERRLPGGVVMSFSYDADTGLLLGYKATRGQAVLLGEDYEQDAAGRINKITGSDGRVRTFSYDPAGRLLSETTVKDGQPRTVSYSYDEIGNRKTRSDGQTTTSYDYDDDNRLVSDGTYSYGYDGAGRMVLRRSAAETVRLRYNGLGRLAELQREGGSGPRLVRYRYDGFGGLMAREVDGKEERYLNDYSSGLPVVLEERDATGKVTRNLLQPGGAVATVFGRLSGGQARYLVPDGLGHVRQVLRGDGSSEGQLDYDAFGNEAAPALADLPYRYAGERYDEAAGLYHLRARRYDPRTGRFLSRDPEQFSNFDPRLFNPYHYAHGDPVNFRDPDGRLAMLGYLLGLQAGQGAADGAAVILSAALLGNTLGSFQGGAHSGTYSSSAIDIKNDLVKIYAGRMSFQDGTRFLYRQYDFTLMPYKGLGVLTFNYKLLGVLSVGEAYGAVNEYSWAGVSLWTELAASAPFKGIAAGAWLHLRLMVMPETGWGGAVGVRRSDVGGLIGTVGLFVGLKQQFGKPEKPKLEGKVGLGLHFLGRQITDRLGDFAIDCTFLKFFPLSSAKPFLTAELCNQKLLGGGPDNGGPAVGSGD